MEKTIYITTPIYYVNAEPHIGHAYTTILADFLKRFYGMIGYDAYFLTGTDEHGDKIMKASEERGSTPREYSDRISAIFRDTWNSIGIGYDDFIRTTEERHIRVVRDVLQRVYDRGDIYFGKYGGYYCIGCERFLTDRDMTDGICPEHGTKPELIEEDNYFFKMSAYQEWLAGYIRSNPEFIRPERYRNEVLSMLEHEELGDLCISRPKSRLQWGITLPFDENYVTYVWFDALINYISAIGYPDDERFRRYWPVVQHFIAKDILKPHGIYWPTMLRSAGLEMYRNLNVHGWWNVGESKMSKSLGNVIRPGDLIGEFGNDQVRYFFLREMTFGLDSKFTEELIINRINYDLANDLGNLVKRCFDMVKKFFELKIPEFHPSHPAGRAELVDKLRESIGSYISMVKENHFSGGIEKVWEFIRFLNKYIDINKPWQLAKEGQKETLASAMRNLMESIFVIAHLLSPVLIDASPRIKKALGRDGFSPDLDRFCSMDLLADGTPIQELGILYPRIEDKKKTEDDKKMKTEDRGDSIADEGLVDIREFARIDLRIAEVLTAEKVEGSDKLLELSIDTGDDKRVIVAGLAEHYSPQDLTGKHIIVVANLKPATIFKRQSRGMLLAARKGKSGKPVLIEIDPAIPVGSKLS